MGNRRKPTNRLLAAQRAISRLPENEQAGLRQVLNLEVPEDEKELLKEVPAKVDGEVVGRALLYDDGSVDFIIEGELSAEAKAKLDEFGDLFSKMMGNADGPS